MTDEFIENYRDKLWRREADLIVENVSQAEAFVENVGFAYALTDMRWTCPSLYVAVCGRRDVRIPKNVQKDPETSQAWVLKDEILQRGKVYYGKMSTTRATFLAPRLLSAACSIWGIDKSEEKEKLSKNAQAILKVLRQEWEMASSDLREAAGIEDRTQLTKAIDELQACFKCIPINVVYVPKFTYIWGLLEGRFEHELLEPIQRQQAIKTLAKAFLTTLGQATEKEFTRILGVSLEDSKIAYKELLKEDYITKVDANNYRLTNFRS
jgi:hypothetical protein